MKSKLEILLGLYLGCLAYLIFQGYNISPLLILSGFVVGLLFMSKNRGLLQTNNYDKVITADYNFSFEDIGGQETAKRELQEALEFLINSRNIQEMGIRPLKGILLTGPPGTGKTLLAKAAASYSDAVYLASSGSEFIEMYAGVGAQRVRSLFKKAREMAKKQRKNRAIIFIDEIEVLGGKRGSNSSHLEYDQTLNQLLVEMDGLTTDEEVQILLIAATNRADLLDPALLRPGRFDRRVRVDLPDKEGRLAILKLHCRNKPLAEDVNLDELAAATFGFSGAHLESLTNEAAILALRDNSKKLTMNHMHDAIDKVILGERLENRTDKKLLYRVAIHEAGHAIIGEILKPGSVDQVTVTSRGNALGYIRQNQQDDQKLFTRSALNKEIMILLAGAVSEEIVFGEKSTGAGNDYQRALELAEKIITNGLSRLGVVKAELIPQNEFYQVCQEIMRELEQGTIKLIVDNQHLLLHIAKELQNKEKISGNELRTILGTNKDDPSITAV
ncbi:MAG: AAA family ATPase [Peptococcia bacterium]